MTNYVEESIFIKKRFFIVFLVKKSINSQTEDCPVEEIEELALDSIHFGKFTPEINALIGTF
jgi:hypothetical protein